MMELLIMIDACKRASAASINIAGTMDMLDKTEKHSREPITANSR